ncbi:hypothetical protein LTR10_000814 [Elasticomyces elasticus]|nr:hypothetical protein LTR10_000814 [Elasticomyces elasticus]KAK4979940.1 hypothetical protein LTR42_000247 [Elasticomyces elasticus]
MATTNSNSSGTMATAVLDLPELLEMIILALPMRKMQRCRRVSRQWRATIDGSLPIKRALFLEPGTLADLACDTEIRTSRSTSRHPCWNETLYHFSTHPRFQIRTHLGYFGVEFMRHTLAKEACRLRNVLVAQPPSTTAGSTLKVYIDYEQVTHVGPKKPVTVTLEAGETFGSLYDKAMKVLADKQWAAEPAHWYWKNGPGVTHDLVKT